MMNNRKSMVEVSPPIMLSKAVSNYDRRLKSINKAIKTNQVKSNESSSDHSGIMSYKNNLLYS